ncbi:unnamed protein product [Urochloa humidicola]
MPRRSRRLAVRRRPGLRLPLRRPPARARPRPDLCQISRAAPLLELAVAGGRPSSLPLLRAGGEAAWSRQGGGPQPHDGRSSTARRGSGGRRGAGQQRLCGLAGGRARARGGPLPPLLPAPEADRGRAPSLRRHSGSLLRRATVPPDWRRRARSCARRGADWRSLVAFLFVLRQLATSSAGQRRRSQGKGASSPARSAFFRPPISMWMRRHRGREEEAVREQIGRASSSGARPTVGGAGTRRPSLEQRHDGR